MADKRTWANLFRACNGHPQADRPALRGDFVYVVEWPDGVTKVGYTSNRSRWRKFVCRGAELVYLATFTNCTDALNAETRAHQRMQERFLPAFYSRDEARAHLGDGCGYLECYMTEGEYV